MTDAGYEEKIFTIFVLFVQFLDYISLSLVIRDARDNGKLAIQA